MSQALLIASVVIFVAACLCPALDFRVFTSDPQDYRVVTDRGGNLLLLGWWGVLAGVPAWLANPCWVASVVAEYWHHPALALGLSVAALLLASSTFRLRRKAVARDEGGVSQALLLRPRIGFALWLAAMALVAAASFIGFF